jgi:hypothetical protein
MSSSTKKNILRKSKRNIQPLLRMENRSFLTSSASHVDLIGAMRLDSSVKNNKHITKKGKPGKYHSTAIIDFLKTLWIVTNLDCSQRLKAAIPLWFPYYLSPHKNI